ncbi:MAG: 6-carboxytetrahydropterin synthase QueD [Acidobacteriota bacterium]
MYVICKEVTFAAAHMIRGYDGKCARIHGHNWRVRLEVACEKLNEIGTGVDFGDLKRILQDIVGKLDHRDLGELNAFAHSNPTAENVARHIFEEASRRLDGEGRRVQRVQLWENDTSSVIYAPEGA